jgi:hypothetical protein
MFDPERHASIYTEGQTVMAAVRAPVWPATHWRCVVSRALARRIAGRMGVSRRASTDVPTLSGPRRRTSWSQRLHNISLHHRGYAAAVR